MPRYTLTKNYLEIAETYGLFQNLSANSDIEITENVDSAGIILKSFHTAIINQKVYARKIGNAGTCPLAVLPFQKLCENPTALPPKRCDCETESDTILDEYEDLFAGDCPNHKPPKMPPLSVRETPSHYLVSVSKDSLKNQNKFLIQFDDKTGG